MLAAVVFSSNRRVSFRITEQHLAMVRASLPGAEVLHVEDAKTLAARGLWADVLIGWGDAHALGLDYCLADPNLKWIHALSAGVENLVDSPVAARPGLRVSNSRGFHGLPISEHVLGWLLTHYRGFARMRGTQQEHAWKPFVADELNGRTVGIIGAGAIGGAISRRCKAFETRVVGVKRHAMPLPDYDAVYPVEHLDRLLAESDVVIMVAPLTPETEGMLDARAFAAMKSGALFANVGRGRTVVTADLVDALASGHLGGALIDAVEPEPLPPDHPLWTLPNVVVSPHMSATTDRYMDRAFACFPRNAAVWLAGGRMPDEVDLRK